MALTKIIDSELSAQKRFHADMPDIPALNADEMKAFMDYVSRRVVIPKVNEMIDEINFVLGASEGGDFAYSKAQTEALLELKADADSVYTKTDTDSLLDAKADSNSVYTKAQSDSLLDAKADNNSVYTKAQSDSLLDAKADSNSVYTKAQSDSLLDAKADSDSVYTKAQTDAMIGGLHDPQDYVTSRGVKENWNYRKWASGAVEAWRVGVSVSVPAGTATGLDIAVPSGIFTAAPAFVQTTMRTGSTNSKFSLCEIVAGTSGSSATNIALKGYNSHTGDFSPQINIYAVQF